MSDYEEEKTESVHGRPKVLAKMAAIKTRLHTLGLRTWIWESLALGVGYLPRNKESERPLGKKSGPPFGPSFQLLEKGLPGNKKMVSGFEVDISGELPGRMPGVTLTRRPGPSPGRPRPRGAHFSYETKNRNGPLGPPGRLVVPYWPFVGHHCWIASSNRTWP